MERLDVHLIPFGQRPPQPRLQRGSRVEGQQLGRIVNATTRRGMLWVLHLAVPGLFLSFHFIGGYNKDNDKKFKTISSVRHVTGFFTALFEFFQNLLIYDLLQASSSWLRQK
jgi:hypothetical protein